MKRLALDWTILCHDVCHIDWISARPADVFSRRFPPGGSGQSAVDSPPSLTDLPAYSLLRQSVTWERNSSIYQTNAYKTMEDNSQINQSKWYNNNNGIFLPSNFMNHNHSSKSRWIKLGASTAPRSPTEPFNSEGASEPFPSRGCVDCNRS